MQSSTSTSSNDHTDDLFPDADKPTTPLAQMTLPQLVELSPPNSQGVPLSDNMIAATAATGLSGANANGKRPLSTLDGNGDALSTSATLRGGGQALAVEAPRVRTHAGSGYSWSKQEDEPGWASNNKRAVEEANRAWDSLVLKDRRVGSE